MKAQPLLETFLPFAVLKRVVREPGALVALGSRLEMQTLCRTPDLLNQNLSFIRLHGAFLGTGHIHVESTGLKLEQILQDQELRK